MGTMLTTIVPSLHNKSWVPALVSADPMCSWQCYKVQSGFVVINTQLYMLGLQ